MMGAGHVGSLQSAAEAASHLATRFAAVVVTAGALGPAADAGGNARLILPAEKVTVVSAHGAGDAFIGALAVALARGADLSTACTAASHAAAKHVSGRAQAV